MTTRQLRARLDRLTPSIVPHPGQDRDRDRHRREELFYRRLAPAGITDREEAEFLDLQAHLHDEDRDYNRKFQLDLKQFSAEHSGTVPLTDIETRELAELNRRFPPDPDHPLRASIEAWARVAAGK